MHAVGQVVSMRSPIYKEHCSMGSKPVHVIIVAIVQKRMKALKS